MRIGDLAERTGVTTKTIRYYESIGLLAEPRRLPSGYRDYEDEAVERLQFVRDAQATGLSLAEIQSILEIKAAGATSCRHTLELISRHIDELDGQIERLHATRDQLEAMARRASTLDPSACTDPNRCQVISDVAR